MKNIFCGVVQALFTMIVCSWTCTAVWAEAPPKLPGQDISGTVANMPIQTDSAMLKPPQSSPLSPEWIEQQVNTWDAPGVFQQINEDATMVPIGKGAIFIPRLSDAVLEPGTEIFNNTGTPVSSGPSGKKYPLLPGEYAVMVGSGSINQRIIKKVLVEEGKIFPILPDWCGLSIDVVDSNNVPFRGQYELARIDEFDAYGRSYGRDITVGERVKTWILKPGLYKIFSAGDSYNTVNNFITVRLVPGEFAYIIVVENQKDLNFKIVGGGEVNTKALSAKKKANWKYKFNVGGTILFNSNSDRVITRNSQNSANLALLSISDITYKKGSNDWETNLFLKEGVNLSDLSKAEVNYTGDQFTLTSLYVWRVILPWLGPYCRTEFQTHLLPGVMQFDENAPNHFFITLGPDSAAKEIDSMNNTNQVQPSFSPITGEAGVGANIDAISSRYFDAKLRLGVGYSQMNVWGRKYQRDSTYTTARKIAPGSSLTTDQLANALTRNYIILQESPYVMSQDYGPEAGIGVSLRAGSWAVARGDYRLRIPIEPLVKNHAVRPDWDVYTTVSWSLTRSITLDYLFQYTLKQPLQEAAHVDVATNSVFLRFSFNTR